MDSSPAPTHDSRSLNMLSSDISLIGLQVIQNGPHDVVAIPPSLLQMRQRWALRRSVTLALSEIGIHIKFWVEVCSSSERLCYNCMFEA